MLNVINVDFTPLYDFAAEIVEMYKEELERQKVNASGELSDSVDFDIDFNENDIVLYLVCNSYARYVEYGRRPTGGGGGQKWHNSVGDIEQWIRNKINRGWFIPRNNRQIPKTDKEIRRTSYAIVRKIHSVGYYGQSHYGLHILEDVLERAQASGLLDKIVQGIAKQYDKEIEIELMKL